MISQDKQKRLEYEAREKAVRDYNQVMLEAEQRGKKEGLQEGREEGKIETTMRIAQNLLLSGFSVDMIAQNTGLSIDQVESLKNQL